MAILQAGSDVYFTTRHTDATSPEISIDGRIYYRFMDFIYIPRATDELSSEQVVVVNRLRHRFRRRVSKTGNDYVKRVLRAIVSARKPGTLLEIGAGYSPLDDASFAQRYVCVDLDPQIPLVLQGRGYDAVSFALGDQLPLPTSTVDMAIAVFVLHFAFADQQIGELARVLATGGVFVGNVYRRSADAREALLRQFVAGGLRAVMVPDPNAICRDNEFLIAGKDSVEISAAAASVATIVSRTR